MNANNKHLQEAVRLRTEARAAREELAISTAIAEKALIAYNAAVDWADIAGSAFGAHSETFANAMTTRMKLDDAFEAAYAATQENIAKFSELSDRFSTAIILAQITQ